MAHRRLRSVAIASVIALASALSLAPTAFSALGGSGNVTDFIDLTTVDGSLDTLVAIAASSSGGIITSSDAFEVHNAGTNVDTFIVYSWVSSPTVGGSATSITLRGTNTYHISDLLWFKQTTLAADGTPTNAPNWSPLVIKSDAAVKSSTFDPDDGACDLWGNNPGGLTLAAAGSFTVKYYTESSDNDAPSTTLPVYYCIDTANSQVYLNSAPDFNDAAPVKKYTVNSANALLETYQYTIAGNKYCVYDISGDGLSALPVLHQCSALPYDQLASTGAKLYALFDPPAFFPSGNMGGNVAFSVNGIQWNPYSSGTTKEA